MWFKIVGPIRNVEVIAEADSLPALRRKLRKCAKVDTNQIIGRAVCLDAGEYRVDLRVGRRYQPVAKLGGALQKVRFRPRQRGQNRRDRGFATGCYRVLRPRPGDSKNLIRVVDGSGEDYLYPARWFRLDERK